MTRVKINPKYKALVPPLTEQERQSLLDDIQKNGVSVPGIVNADGVLLDGHHRFDACEELGLKFPCTTKYFKDKLDEEEFVITINLNRRHLTTGQKVQLGLELERIESLRIKQKESLRKKGLLPIGSSAKMEAAEVISKKLNIPIRTYHKGKVILTKGDSKMKQQFIKGDLKADKGYNTIKHEERREKAKKEAFDADWKKTMGHDKYELLQGDILEMGEKIGDNSIDLIFTDPPYLGETLNAYNKLGQLAMRVLKPGGSLLTIVGHHYIFDINERILEHDGVKTRDHYDLRYHWMIVLRHGGHARRVHAYGVWAHYKPILWYYKPKKGSQKPTMYHDMADLIESKPVDKTLHEWEQSTIEAEHFINALTVERELVLDPFLGSGSTGIAALQLNRRFRGIEIDPETMKIAAKRLSEL